MSKPPKIIQQYIASYNAFDISGMLKCLTEDVEFQNISGNEVNAHSTSKDEFSDLAHQGAEAFSSRHQRALHSISVGDMTLVEIDYKATVARDLPNGWKAGQEIAFEGASAFKIKDGLISKISDQS